MAKVVDQNIPASLQAVYEATLGQARWWKRHFDVRKRYPWRLPHMQGDGRITKDPDLGGGVTHWQWLHRKIFRRACDCYNIQLPSFLVIDPPFGPKSRGYWHEDALGSGLWYYDYFMQQTINAFIATGTPNYCKKLITADAWVDTLNPDTNYNDDWDLKCVNWDGYQQEIYVKKDDPLTHIYHFWVADIGGYPWRENLYITFHFWEVKEDWNETTITWNNKPPGVKLIAVKKISWDAAETYQEVQLPNVKYFKITTKYSIEFGGSWYGMILDSRRSEPPHWFAPYWT